MKLKIIRFIEGVQNVIKWLPVIWHDVDFDYHYLYKILHFKLKNMQEYLESDYAITADAKKTAKQIMIAKNLCKRLIDDNYLDNALRKYETQYGSSDVISFEPTENEYLHQLIWNWTDEKQEKDFGRACEHSEYMERQDIDYLFNFMKKHIQGWWG